MNHPHHRHGKSLLSLGLATALVAAGTGTAIAATTNPNPNPMELNHAALSQRAATEGMVLLENRNAALPMPTGGNVAIFGVGAYKTVKGGTGSGDVNNRDMVTARQGLENAGYQVTTSDDYYQAMVQAFDDEYGQGGGGLFGPAIDYSSVEQALTSQTVNPTAPTDTAIYVIARNSGEGADRTADKGDYQLADVERANIKLIGETYKNVIVVINSGGIIDTSWYDQINSTTTDPDGHDAIDALFLMSQAGERSGDALVEVLNGTVTPSGKLTDTWASKYSYYPASATFGNNDGDIDDEDYSEGVYVGYRYFDSFAQSIDPGHADAVVDYPFGYGQSYTSFQTSTESVEANIDNVTVRARVTNIGDTFSGKEVVEVYASAPQNGLDKPYQQLAGYAKTDTLAPGASQIVTITFPTSSLASYDTGDPANVLDKGDYLIRVGDSSRSTHVAAKLHLAHRTVVEQLANELDGTDPADDLTSDPADFYSYASESAEIAAAPSIQLNTDGFVAPDHSSPYEQDIPASDTGVTAPYYAIDGDLISSTTVYLPNTQTDWEGTGEPYQTKPGEIVNRVATDPSNTLYDVASGDITMSQFVAGLSVDQLANIVEGASASGSTLTADGAAGYTTAAYENLGIPAMTLSDGPAGLRITQKINSSPTTYQWATAWPIGTLLAQTWNRDLVQQVGEAIGAEMQEYGATLWLAPGMDLHRDPLNGRNFEYFSEDPLVTGLTAAAETTGVQSVPGVGVTVKHFATNNQEANRSTVNNHISERALRELYLKGFEIVVKSAQPMAVMNAYNQINNTHAAANHDLNMDVLRGEWGFDGVVMTDWTGVGQSGIVPTIYSGDDLIEPGNNPGEVINALKRVDPTVDVTGLPVYKKQERSFGSFHFTNWNWQLGGLTLDANGDQTFSTTVDGNSDLSDPASGEIVTDQINNQGFVPHDPYASVDEAYQEVEDFLSAGNDALRNAQKAAISVSDVEHQNGANSPVTAYTLTFTGHFPEQGFTMRLGDVQRAAANVLKTVERSAPFGELAEIQDVSGVNIKPYTSQFDDLTTYLSDSASAVAPAQTGSRPSVTLQASSNGWHTGPATVTISSDDPDALIYYEIDKHGTQTYTGPVSVSDEGSHTVQAFAVDADQQISTIKSTTVKVDSTAPTVKAKKKKAKKGRLKLKAKDGLSGVKKVQYSTNGGKKWKTYSSKVAFATKKLPMLVSYRAIDKAGNTSATKSVKVKKGKIKVKKKAKIKKRHKKNKVRVGKKLKVTKGKYQPKNVKIKYRWFAGKDKIKGKKGKKKHYKIRKADKGSKLRVKVKVKKKGYKKTTYKTTKTVKVKKKK